MQSLIRILFSRNSWLLGHQYLALILGLFFVFQGVTGSLCVYRTEIEQFLNPSKSISPLPTAPVSLDKVLQMLHETHPERQGVWVLELPLAQNQPLTAIFEKPRETEGVLYAPLLISINPYTGEIIDTEFWGESLVTRLIDLHVQLNREIQGRNFVALLGLAWLLSILSGLSLWWPGWKRLINLKHPRSKQSPRLVSQLHRRIGIVSSAGLLIIALTGMHLAYPELLEKLTNASGMGHGDPGPTIISTGVQTGRPITLTEAVLMAKGPFSSAKVRRVTTPLGDLGTYKINLTQKDEVNQQHPVTTIWIDRWSGQIRNVVNPKRLTREQSVMSWMWPLHTGEAFGGYHRALWFCLGFVPLLLYMTGLTAWFGRKKR